MPRRSLNLDAEFTRFTFALPDDLRMEAEQAARASDLTLSQLCRRGLRRELEAGREGVVITTSDESA